MQMITFTAISYTMDDIQHVRDQRRFWARAAQEADDKQHRKYCLKYTKATTIVLEYMTGHVGGNFDSLPLDANPDFPEELIPFITTIFCFATVNPTITFESIYNGHI